MSRLVYKEFIVCVLASRNIYLKALSYQLKSTVTLRLNELEEKKKLKNIELKRIKLNFKFNKKARDSSYIAKQSTPEPRSLQNNHRRDRNIGFIDSGLLKLVSP